MTDYNYSNNGRNGSMEMHPLGGSHHPANSSLRSPTGSLSHGPKDSLNTSVAELAADSKAKKDGKGFCCGFHLPVSVMVIFIVFITLGSVAGPLFYILQTNTINNINNFGGIVIAQAVDKIITKVQDTIDLPVGLISIALSNPSLQRAMVTNNRNLRSEIDTFLFLASLTNTSDYIQGINCASYPNLFDGEPLVPTSPNTTVIGSYEAASQVSNVALFMDTTSYPFLNQMNLTSIENPAYTEPFRAFPFPWAPLMMTFDYFAAMITNPRNLGVTFSITFNNGVMITGVNQVKYTNRSTEFPSFACSLGVENEKALGKLFSEIKVTPNSKVIMIDTLTGSLVANAEPKSIFKILPPTPQNPAPVEHFNLTTTPDRVAQMIGKTLTNIYGSYTKVENTGQTISRLIDIGDGQNWFLNTRYLAQPSNWMVIVATPRSDFFAETDAATKKAVILASSVAAAGVIIAAIAAVLLMRPLYKLSRAMELLTNLDFSALEGNILRDRSFVSEVRNLQITFSTMCKAFASGIRRNRALAGGTFTSKQQAQSSSAY